MDAIEQLFASQAAERKAAVLEFTPDEIRITAENKFDDGIYQLLYDVWKKTSGEYDPKDDKPIVDPRGNVHTQNETKFKYWAMEQYGMTAEEYRGHTLDGTLKTLDEIDTATNKVMMILALPSMIKNAVKTIKDFANGVPFDTSIGFVAGNDGRRQAQNAAGDAIEEAAEKVVKKEIKEEVIGNLTKKIPQKYKEIYKCEEYANSLEKLMKKNGISGEKIHIESNSWFIYSDKYGGNISENKQHYAIKIGNKVYDNMTPNGMNYDNWLADLGIKDIPWEFKITSKPIN